MSVAEYAAHRGVSDSYIRRMRRDGNLVLVDGDLIDPRASDQLLDELTHPLRGGPRPGSGRPPGGPASAPSGARDGNGAAPPTSPARISVQEAVRRERLARARLAELELGEQSGQLMRVDEATRVLITFVRQALNQLQGMSARLSTTLAAETDAHQISVLIDSEVARVCAELRAGATLQPAAASSDADADAEADDASDIDEVAVG